MSDDVPKDLCAKKINVNLRLPPTEVWTDIFSFLPRRTLVQRVQPVTFWFKAICDKNVKSIHVIGYISDFMRKLGQKKPVAAERQLEALAGNNCTLAEHFRMNKFRNYYNGRNEMEKLSVLRHSLDLFRHCQLIIYPQARVLCSVDELAEYYQAYLTLLEPTKPSYILMQMDFGLTKLPVFPQSRFSQLLCHPTTLNCARVKLYGRMLVWDNRQAIFEWLHYQVDIGEYGEEVRCLNLYSVDLQNTQLQFFEWLLEQCVQNFEQSKVPEDRRYFVLTFRCFDNELDNFEYKNPATGEVLFLERVLNEYEYGPPSRYQYYRHGGPPSRYQYYRLLRCLAHRVVNGTNQLFAKLFESDNFFKFNLDRAGDVAKVQIS